MSRRKLIEVSLPLNSLNVAAQKDKNPFLKGHPRSLHLWWSRKPLAVCRAILFASLVDDPSSRPDLFPTTKEQKAERKRLLSFMETLINSTGSDDTVFSAAKTEIEKSTAGQPPSIYDPFAGGGSIPLEAKRLGLEAHGSDINPLAVIINKALIEIPEKFSDKTLLAKAIRHYGKWMQEEGLTRLDYLYSKRQGKVVAWLYCRSVKCPNESCDYDVPLISKFWLCTRQGKQAWLDPVIENGQVRFDIATGIAPDNCKGRLGAGTRLIKESGSVAKAAFQCLACGECVRGKHLHAEAENGKLKFLPLAAVIQDRRGRRYSPFHLDEMQSVFETCQIALDKYRQTGSLPEEKTRGTFASNAQGRSYGLKTFCDYFLPRQLLSLCVLSDLIEEARKDILQSGKWSLPLDATTLEAGGHGLTAFADAVATYLAFAVNHLVRYSTLLNPWNTTNQNVAQIFGRQAMQMTWDFAEANILDGSLTIATASEWVASAVEKLPIGDATKNPATVRQLNSVDCTSPAVSPVIITDPPYFNYISYADLSDFFYVWLKRSLKEVHPHLFKGELSPKSEELVVTPHRFAGDEVEARKHFTQGLTHSFSGLHDMAHSEYPIAVFYAFNPKSTFDFSGWEAMLESLIGSGWMLTACWTLATERSTRMVARGTQSLASSLLLILRKRPASARSITAKALCTAIETELAQSLIQLEREVPVDKLQLSLIEGAKILSRYCHVEGNDGHVLSVAEAIKLVIAQPLLKVT